MLACEEAEMLGG